MIKAHRITSNNLDGLKAIYDRFREKAIPEYRWSGEPLPFDALKVAFLDKQILGYWVEDTAHPEPIAFLLYKPEAHRALEINMLYSEVQDYKTVLDRLMRLFIADNRETTGWDVVSYAMLGLQEAFIRTITWYGFKPIGQAILSFDLTDPLSVQIAHQQQFTLPGPDYRLDCWQPQYAGAVAECVYDAFSSAVDSLWDPRFKTLLGARSLVGVLTSDLIGKFMPSCTSVLLRQDEPIGFCFLLQDTLTQAHIPLIGLKPDEKRKNLGNALLRDCLDRVIQEMLAGHNSILKIYSTTDTDNIRAIKMYRRMGFREEYNYPHVYLTRDKLLAFQPGKWC